MAIFALILAIFSLVIGLFFIALLMAEKRTVYKLSSQFVNITTATILMAIGTICLLLYVVN
jgi:hypothetical protein